MKTIKQLQDEIKSIREGHRHLLAEWLRKGGLEVEEFGAVQIEIFK